MKASTLAPLTLLAFMATIQHSCALPAPDLLKRVPVANPSLPFPQPSIGHGPVSIPSTLPTPVVQPRDSTAEARQAGGVQLPDSTSQGPTIQRRGAPICPLGTSQGPDGTCHGTTSPGTPIQRREVPICPLGTSQNPDGTCHGTTSPGTPIQRREVPICPLGSSQGPDGTCHGTTSPGTPIQRRDGTGQAPDDSTVAPPA